MSRLLFAAARGARVQMLRTLGEDVYVQAGRVPLTEEAQSYYRIHPDDEHLQYGPISSAMRELATTGKFSYTVSAMLAREALMYEIPVRIEGHEIDTVATFALILAEYFADEGM